MQPDPREQNDIPFGSRREEEEPAWPAPVAWQRLPEGVAEEIERRSWRRAFLLFFVTLLSVFWVGARMTASTPGQSVSLLDGWTFAVPLLIILLCHEFGHYLQGRRHGVAVSPPYFLPFPNLFGTMGAFISIRSPIPDRRVLFDISAAGPLSGFLPSVIALVIGYELSTVAPMITEPNLVVYQFGDSLLTWIIQQLTVGPVAEGLEVWIHPVGLAGWVGLFITMLNLIPIGTLDGGHLAYAVFGRRQWTAGRIVLLSMFVLGFTVSWIWLTLPIFFTLLIAIVWMIMKRTGRTDTRFVDFWRGLLLKHPPVPDESPLDTGRKWLGWVCLVVFALCFIPVPLRAIVT
jgi:membrane-associated protease RseP (regulator of RpoE activity)